MASKSKKLVVNKDDLRRLMKEKSSTIQKDKKKIDSPLAKYDSIGNLYCVVCSIKIKSHLVWNAHVMGRSHKQSVERLKEEQHKKSIAPPTVALPPPPSAAPRSILKNSTVKRKAPESENNGDSKRHAPSTSALSLGNYGSSSESDGEEEVEANEAPSTSQGGIPADFFDKGVTPSKSADSKTVKEKDTPETSKSDTMAEKLPEGFFDDAKMDAKVREVEYKDKMDDEWAMFQKEIQTATIESEVIAEEESEVVQTTRDIQMVDDQLYHLRKVTELAKKKDSTVVVKSTEKRNKDSDSDIDSDIDDEDLLEGCNWRTKKV